MHYKKNITLLKSCFVRVYPFLKAYILVGKTSSDAEKTSNDMKDTFYMYKKTISKLKKF